MADSSMNGKFIEVVLRVPIGDEDKVEKNVSPQEFVEAISGHYVHFMVRCPDHGHSFLVVGPVRDFEMSLTQLQCMMESIDDLRAGIIRQISSAAHSGNN